MDKELVRALMCLEKGSKDKKTREFKCQFSPTFLRTIKHEPKVEKNKPIIPMYFQRMKETPPHVLFFLKKKQDFSIQGKGFQSSTKKEKKNHKNKVERISESDINAKMIRGNELTCFFSFS